MSEFIKRTLSGAVYVAVVVAAILSHPLASTILFLAIALLAVREFHLLMKSSKALIAWSAAIVSCIYMAMAPSLHPTLWGLLAVLLLLVAFVSELFTRADNPMQNWGNMLTSVVWTGLPFALMPLILKSGDFAVQRYVLLALFVCIWLNDTGAYCVGSLIGKHKMFPRVSPGKSWEGLVGGFVFSLLAGYVFSLFVQEYALWQWLLMAFTISLAGTFGDLVESLLKRTLGVKDSGNFMPGHGGVLDRFDSILLATPAIWLLLQVF